MGARRDDSNGPAEVVRRYCEAWMAGDLAAVLDHYHPDLTLDWPGSHRFAGTHHGLNESLTALAALGQATNRTPVAIRGIFESNASVLALVDERWSDDDDAIKITRALVFEVEAGQLRTCTVFEHDPERVDDWIDRHRPPSRTRYSVEPIQA